MSRCPPPLGPMSWGGRSSICRASSPTVSVLPRQESPHRQKRSINQGASPASPGEHTGQPGTQSRSWHGGGDEEHGQSQQGVRAGAGEQCSFGPAPLPAASGSRRGRQVPERGLSQDPEPCHPCCPRLYLEAGAGGFLLPSEQCCPVTSVSAFPLLQAGGRLGLLRSFPSSSVPCR